MPFSPVSAYFSFSPSSLKASQQNMWFTYLFLPRFGLMWMFPDGEVERRRLGDGQLHQSWWPLLSHKIKCSNRVWENMAHSRL